MNSSAIARLIAFTNDGNVTEIGTVPTAVTNKTVVKLELIAPWENLLVEMNPMFASAPNGSAMVKTTAKMLRTKLQISAKEGRVNPTGTGVTIPSAFYGPPFVTEFEIVRTGPMSLPKPVKPPVLVVIKAAFDVTMANASAKV